MSLRKVQFMDGERDVPSYFVSLLSALAIDFHQVTYEQAKSLLGTAMERKYLNGYQERLVADHLVMHGQAGGYEWE